MRNVLRFLLIIIILVFTLNCRTDSHSDDLQFYITTITVNFEYGIDLSPTAYKNIYIIWIEDKPSSFIQNISVCQKLVQGGLTGTALPYWKINKYPISSSSEIDAVTSATKANTNFSVSAVLKDNTIRKFVLYFEIDRSYEPNDWFSDQPALLYSAFINLDESTSTYELLPLGWTPNESTQNIIQNTPFGQLQNEMRYITNLKEGLSFGLADARSATKMVKKITVFVERSNTSGLFSTPIDNNSISIYPNPSPGQINIKSTEIIDEVVITNMQGQTILRFQPKTFKTTFTLDKLNAPIGSYFAKITTSESVSTHKLQITE